MVRLIHVILANSVHDPGLTTFCTCKLDAKVKFTRKPMLIKDPH